MDDWAKKRMTYRQLEAIAASEIMGWPVKWTEVTRNRHPMGWKQAWVKTSDIAGWSKCPNFAGDMDAAIRLVERMAELNWRFRLSIVPGGRIEAEFDRADDDRWASFVVDTRTDCASAILMAALEAFGVELPEELRMVLG